MCQMCMISTVVSVHKIDLAIPVCFQMGSSGAEEVCAHTCALHMHLCSYCLKKLDLTWKGSQKLNN